MYKVYHNGSLMYDTTIDDKRQAFSDAKLDIELNKAGSFEFTLYPRSAQYDFQPLKSIITVYQNDYLIFRGRVLNTVTGLYNEKQVLCEGELAFLCDSIQTPFRRTAHTDNIKYAFTRMIERHNELMIEGEDTTDSESKKFKVGIIDVEYNGELSSDNMIEVDYSTTWDAINKSLINVFGGYLLVRHEEDGNYIDYVSNTAEPGVISGKPIEPNRNLLSFKREIKGEDIVTALIPLGKDDINITDVNNGLNYIYDKEAVEQYGWIFRTETWDDITSKETLLATAQERLKELSKPLLSSIEIGAADLSPVDNVSPFRLGTNVRVISSPHGLDEIFLIKKLQISLTKPSTNKLTLDGTFKTLTQTFSSQRPTSGDVSKAYTYTDTAVNTLASDVSAQIIDINTKLNTAVFTDENGVIQFAEANLNQVMTIGIWTFGIDEGLSDYVIRCILPLYKTLSYTTSQGNPNTVTGYVFTVLRTSGICYVVKETEDYSSNTLVILSNSGETYTETSTIQ